MIIMKKKKLKSNCRLICKKYSKTKKIYEDGAVTYYPHGLQPNIYSLIIRYLSEVQLNRKH